jgi:tetratricopeptide (TPR) repeat protein
VHVLDARTGRELYTLQGHSAPVTEVAFTPDSRRIVTTTGRALQLRGQFEVGETKLWDAQSGHELLNLETPLVGLTLTADGTRLIGEHWGFSGTRLVSWEASPLSPEHEAEQFVGPLRSQRQNGMPLSRAEMRRRLEADGALNGQSRAAADRLIGEVRHDRLTLSVLALEMINDAGREPAVYRQFLELASDACETNGDERWPWNFRGYAHYRLGQYPEALAALERAREIQANAGERPLPNNLVFLAMTQHKLGRVDLARQLLLESEQIVSREPDLEPGWRRVANEAQQLLGINLDVHMPDPMGQ